MWCASVIPSDGQKKLIEQAYTLGAQLGLSVWCEDEAGPFQAVPHAWRVVAAARLIGDRAERIH